MCACGLTQVWPCCRELFAACVVFLFLFSGCVASTLGLHCAMLVQASFAPLRTPAGWPCSIDPCKRKPRACGLQAICCRGRLTPFLVSILWDCSSSNFFRFSKRKGCVLRASKEGLRTQSLQGRVAYSEPPRMGCVLRASKEGLRTQSLQGRVAYSEPPRKGCVLRASKEGMRTQSLHRGIPALDAQACSWWGATRPSSRATSFHPWARRHAGARTWRA